MNFVSLEFLIFALLAVVVLRLPIPFINRDLRLLGLNTAFVASYFSAPDKILPVMGFVLLGYAALFAGRLRFPAILATLVAAVTLLFVWLKQYTLVTALSPQHLGNFAFATVGLSYILFRVLHVLIDTQQGSMKRPSFLRYLNYCFFFPNFVSGPIQRYDDFTAQVARPMPPLTPHILHAALGRIILGIFMTLVISAAALKLGHVLQNLYYVHAAMPHHYAHKALYLGAAAAVYLVNLFANFAGYMHIVIGVGKICGFDIPENFNKPYLAKNFLDLWARWHITLSDWFKFYLFNPLLKYMAQKWDNPHLTPYLGAIAFFVTFLIMGVWHGTTILFVIYGGFLGLAAMVNKAWQIFMAQKLGRKGYKDLAQRNWYFQISRALTLGYFAVSLICLWLDPTKLPVGHGWRIVPETIGSLLLVTLAFTVLGGVIDKILLPVASRLIPSATQPPSEGRMIITMALKLVAIIYILLVMGDSAPEFIYKAF